MEGAQYEPAMHPSPSEQAFAFAFAVDHYADQPPPGAPITSVAARPSSSFPSLIFSAAQLRLRLVDHYAIEAPLFQCLICSTPMLSWDF